MKKLDVAQTVGLLANLGVLAGIVALVIEINQNTAHTRALLVDQLQSRIDALNAVHLVEDPTPAIEKSLLTPGSLTFAEYRVVDAYLINGVNIMHSYRQLSEAGLSDDETWRDFVRDNAVWYFGNRYAKNWWEKVGRSVFDQELVEALDEAISDLDDSDTYDFYLNSIEGL